MGRGGTRNNDFSAMTLIEEYDNHNHDCARNNSSTRTPLHSKRPSINEFALRQSD